MTFTFFGGGLNAQNIGERYYVSDSTEFEIVQVVFHQDVVAEEMWIEYAISSPQKLSKSQFREAKELLKQISAGIKVYVQKKYGYQPNIEDYQRAEMAYKKIQITQLLIDQKENSKRKAVLVLKAEEPQDEFPVHEWFLKMWIEKRRAFQQALLSEGWIRL
jgi:hypothetical protein